MCIIVHNPSKCGSQACTLITLCLLLSGKEDLLVTIVAFAFIETEKLILQCVLIHLQLNVTVQKFVALL
jgi:F0F1-type ATP synthase assembly protein I